MSTATCWVSPCPQPVALSWVRRPTVEELEAELGPGPLPPVDDTTWAVNSCAEHQITPDLAAMIHQPTCHPDLALLPQCPCSPSPPPYIPLAIPADLL